MSSKRAAGSADAAPAPAAIPQTQPGDICRYGDIELNTRTLIARRGDRILRLDPTGLKLLAFFIGRPECAHTRAQILEALRGDRDGDVRTVDVYIRRLRATLNRGADKDPVRTVRGVGYALTCGDPAHVKRVQKVRLRGMTRHRVPRAGSHQARTVIGPK